MAAFGQAAATVMRGPPSTAGHRIIFRRGLLQQRINVPLAPPSWRAAALSHKTPRVEGALGFCASVGIVGGGQMGSGIAFVALLNAKLPVVLVDTSKSQLAAALAYISAQLERRVAKKKILPEERDRVLSSIQTAQDMAALKDADFIVEAAPEAPELKRSIMREMAAVSRPDAILATNTSSISITHIAAAAADEAARQRIIGMHFMNPVPQMALIEIIPGLATSPLTVEKTEQLARAMGKTTARSRDVPGFVANRLLMPYLNEAVCALYEGLATREDIDRTMLLGTNMPMGPLALADFIGLDTTLAILTVLHLQLGEDKYRPCPLLRSYVHAGWLGKKSGRGFYDYTKELPPTVSF